MIEYEGVKEAADFIAERISRAPEVGLILGTGLAGAAASMDVEAEIPYADVPGMNLSTNIYHPGRFLVGTLCGRQVICMQGRIHLYEDYSVEEVAFPVFVMHLLGVERLIVTNAAGAINTDFSVEQFIVIADHINYMGVNPLFYSIDDRLARPCPDMTYAYTPALRERLLARAAEVGEDVREGVYIGVRGPSFETPAEIRAFRTLGADLVGMSTVPEVIAAAACDMEVAGISLVTNMAAGVGPGKIDEAHLMQHESDVPARLAALIESVVA
ncbi:MAG: purine-nucleoside phosphorylase [Coriobacteriales bacterium]|jgi:purine-nucleoside phosphorylase